MPDETSPAAVAEAPVETAPVESPETTTPAAPAAVTEPAPPPAEPDIDSLLSNDEVVKRALQNERMKREIEHRVKSEAGRIAKAQLEATEARRAAAAEAQRLKEMDPFDLGEHVKKQWDEQEREQALLSRSLAQLGQMTDSVIQTHAGLTDEDRAALQPQLFPDWPSYLKASLDKMEARVEVRAKELAKELAKSLAKQEAEAIVQERLGQAREKETVPPTMPNGDGAGSDSEFLNSYAAGRSNDHARARKLLSL